MCDSAAPGMRTGSARDIVFPSAPWLAAHARACQSSFEQAGARAALPFALPHGHHWQDRPGPA